MHLAVRQNKKKKNSKIRRKIISKIMFRLKKLGDVLYYETPQFFYSYSSFILIQITFTFLRCFNKP